MIRAIRRAVGAVASRIGRHSAAGDGVLFERLRSEIEVNRILLAQERVRQLRNDPDVSSLADAEFRVFSQFGEDGIIQYLISRVPVERDAFVEIGVEDYTEANTRFLLQSGNWRGLLIERDPGSVARIRRKNLIWRHDLTVLEAFVTRENVNDLLVSGGVTGDIGLLSIDVDGNDYWIWGAVRVVSPRIVVIEYNSVFGPEAAVSIPYEASFSRARAHDSRLYFGASLRALCHLAAVKGYTFAGTTNAGNNAFFVRTDVASRIRPRSSTEGYVESRFTESRDRAGQLSFLRGRDRLEAIGHLPVVDVVSGQLGPLSQLCR
jgi:hypothetical protein